MQEACSENSFMKIFMWIGGWCGGVDGWQTSVFFCFFFKELPAHVIPCKRTRKLALLLGAFFNKSLHGLDKISFYKRGSAISTRSE